VTRYQHYVYAYPHKTAYRRIEPALPLGPLWASERRDALFVYVHIPFCEQRCGFCNLFTQPVPEHARVAAYLDTLDRQVTVVERALAEGGAYAFARAAIGGGTPTLLDAHQLERVVGMLRRLGAPRGIPMSVESSPETALPDRLAVVVGAGGADRISIGVQSFIDAECKAVNRPQQAADVHRALAAIRASGVATLNVDLMYGLPGQTATTWEYSLRSALEYRPEELYLYPLYVRPLTTLGRKGAEAGGLGGRTAPQIDAHRVALYEQGRALLAEAGYRQISLRMFSLRQAPSAPPAASRPGPAARGGARDPLGEIPEGFKHADAATTPAPVYCCQADGMIGLGCGARSYTRGVHYSSEWAVGARGVRDIIDRWIVKPDEAFAVADYGFVLDAAEQRRRWLILSLLSDDGLDLAAYRARFASDAAADFPEVAALPPEHVVRTDAELRLTPEGLAHADAIGPALFSADVRRRMAEYDLT
jgi:oxygen-independent coproporphyrinogen III oxidase